MLSHRPFPSKKSLQQVRANLNTREYLAGKSGWAADPDSRGQASEKTDSGPKLILNPKANAWSCGKGGPKIEREVEVEECLCPVLPKISSVPGDHGPLERVRFSGLNERLELVSVVADGRADAEAPNTARVLFKSAAPDQFTQLEASAEKQAESAAMIEALSGRCWAGRQQKNRQGAAQALPQRHSFGPIETVRDPVRRTQSRWI